MSIYMNIRDLIGEATEYDKKLELDVTQDVTQDVNSNDLDTQIINLIKIDGKVSTEQMSKIIELSFIIIVSPNAHYIHCQYT